MDLVRYFGQVAQAPARVRGAGQHALGVDLGAEPDDVHRPGVRGGIELVECVVPSRERFAGLRVDVALPVRVPLGDESVVGVDRLVARRPPHLVVGGSGDPAQVGPGHGAAHGQVKVRREPALWFDGGEVLHVPADEPAEVLYEPVDQPAEVERVPGGPPVVVAVRVDRRPVRPHRTIRVEGAGHEQRRPEPAGVDAPDRRWPYPPAWQVRGILPPPR